MQVFHRRKFVMFLTRILRVFLNMQAIFHSQSFLWVRSLPRINLKLNKKGFGAKCQSGYEFFSFFTKSFRTGSPPELKLKVDESQKVFSNLSCLHKVDKINVHQLFCY